jgi:hypothetical protein
MSYCVKCGLEYEEKQDNNFCARCGCGLRKSAPPILQRAQNTFEQLPPGQPQKKPIVGIVVALVFGTTGLLWCFAVLFHLLYGTPGSAQVALQQIFPSTEGTKYIGTSFGLTGNAVLIIGALLACFNHPKGAKVVRITSYCMIGLTFVSFVISYFLITDADAWQTLDASMKGGIIGGLIGGMIGSFFEWGLLLFLFRNRQQKDSKANRSDSPPILRAVKTDHESAGSPAVGKAAPPKLSHPLKSRF